MGKVQNNRLQGLLIEAIGWLLVVVGIVALVLPGPGLLALFAGLAFLATRYDWAERRLEPVKAAALKAAADSVASLPRILISTCGVLALISLGIFRIMQAGVPRWWPLPDTVWQLGGKGTGYTLIGSGIIAAVMIVYSFMHYREG